MRRPRGVVAIALAAVVSLGGTVASTVHVRQYTVRPYLYDNLYLPTGRFIELASLGYRELVADFVWFQAVQYYGGYRLDQHDLQYFDGLMRIVTRLDPKFVFAYIFGAVVLASDLESYDEGIALLRQGMGNNPDNGWLPFEIGFLSYVERHDLKMAARYFDLASRLPGGGDRARRFAAFVYQRAGDVDDSIRAWEALRDTTDEPFMRELAEHYIEKLRRQKARGERRRDT